MSEGMNKCMLLGNLCADPELRFTQGGQAVLNMRMATNETYLDKDRVRKERTDFHSVTVWGKRGEALAKILGKGSSLFVEGSIHTSSYDDRDGVKRYKTEIVARNVILTGSRPAGAAPAPERATPPMGGRPGAAAPAAPAPQDDGGGYAADDGDIPF